MSLTLTNIPSIMTKCGWSRGAALMSQWFLAAAQQYPKYAAPNTTAIQMSWVLGHSKPKTLYDSIFEDRIWANEAARKILTKRLKTWGMFPASSPQRFDQTLKQPTALESEYINYRPYGGAYSGYSGYYETSGSSGSGYSAYDNSNNASGQSYGGLNDLVAALGAFTFRVVVGGSIAPAAGGHEVTINKVGVYVRDSYDFEGFQFLGFWNDSDNSVSAYNPFSGTAVFNSTFRDYRDKNHVGGDMLVFSDVLVTTLNPVHKFKL